MKTLDQIRIERKPEVLHRFQFSNATLYKKISDGLFVPPIKLGVRASGWLSHENNLLLAAYISSKPTEEIRALVSQLVEQRKFFGELSND